MVGLQNCPDALAEVGGLEEAEAEIKGKEAKSRLGGKKKLPAQRTAK